MVIIHDAAKPMVTDKMITDCLAAIRGHEGVLPTLSMKDTADWILGQTDGMGADVFFECVGRNETVSQALTLTAPRGKIIMVGNPATDIMLDKAVYWKILRSQLTVMGTWNSSFTQDTQDDWHYVPERLKDGRIMPEELISHRFTLEELPKGLELMRDKREEYGKVMIVAQ